MSDGPYEVTTVLAGETVLTGRIHRTRTTGAFAYDTNYLRRTDAFALTPGLPLYPGAQPLSPINPFSDSAPDTWGRKVQMRAAGHELDELTLMFGVNDAGRQGATRFFLDGRPVTEAGGVPVESELAEIIHVADQIGRNERMIDDAAIRRLYRATGSLGGARPKANVRYRDGLWLAKFPKPIGDDWNVMAWEAAALDAMAMVGIDVPGHETTQVLVRGEERTILLLQRFDRRGVIRVPYISAMTALEARDGTGGDWIDVADFAQLHGAGTRQLWHRAVFGSLIGNVDDHLRNHGFLRAGADWRLAPAFDVNPTPLGGRDEHELALFGDRAVTLDSLMTRDARDVFNIDAAAADAFVRTLPEVIAALPLRAQAHGADALSVDVMAARIRSALSQVG